MIAGSFRFEGLGKEHHRGDFSCGEEALSDTDSV